MKLIVDAQLPRRLSNWFCSIGHDSIHTLDLPERNRTADDSVAKIADSDGRIVVTKDSDFLSLKLLTHSPQKLLFVSAGNLNNDSLLHMFESNIDIVEKLFLTFEIVEINASMVIGRNLD
ncbi:MAG: DUF5615 family PIN-like protein [Acidobacteria bacterium]|nr:DUF5615 family PIN-like protein [Acidobacteriota bacterium]